MSKAVYSFGYQGADFSTFVEAVRTRGVTVIDTRLKPVSRNPTWNRSRLQAALGAAYAWIEDLGNLNYRGGPIAVRDERRGLESLRTHLANGPIVLMCVCRDEATCHRATILKRLEADGILKMEWCSQ